MTKYKLAKKRERKVSWFVLCCLGLCLIGAGVGIFYLKPQWLPMNFAEDKKVETTTPKKVEKKEEKPKTDLPQVSTKDWNLVLINRDNKLAELNPQLVDVEEIKVDSRIAEQTKQFLAAARAIAPEESLISGYRSVEEQTELYNERVAQLEATGLSHEEAERQAQAQVQVPGASEHQTGLAIDMSAPNGLSEEVVQQIIALAPQYGFVLRYPEGKNAITGVDYENWHFRYVGVENAQYMVKHQLVLEEYIQKLKEAGL
ncbi:M15 family metallopeptidase [Streptococcus australis]|uniref:M15 family metallopeptidase n=1 Tax=Streptococcus australis TaxID=113107 RepID=UPI001CBCB48E|nr:M15 family metallopeptidase [Streptococcus australis]MBZ2154538.1 M15 family metallopeptidase [Streptococcus australis]